MYLGKSIRLERIFNRNTHKTIIVPLDHGVSVGPIHGLVDLRDTVNKVAEGGANAVLMHKGIPRRSHRGRGRDIGLIIHLSASSNLSPYPNTKTLVGSVEDAIRLGADAVSFHLNLGDEAERHMLKELGQIATSADDWGMPLLAMVYARGPKVKSEYDPEVVRHCARLAEELGADVVKVPYTGNIETFHEVVEGCAIPVVIAGGPRMENDRDILQMAYDANLAGGSGLSVGRNIFQAKEPSLLVKALHGIIHENQTVEQAITILEH
ncbi:MAG: 2-amino-3,7-dideoxy-D-threo-hept-6-ulosonate synthase [Proteobacteria bacterium]|nr:2-amino-3,7-dideoxy-D-threo-hept-6-ulosonate synthase [Pseudomonadota bacterium]MBU4471772.1 2-amino-3,7-dideoxy-D-threo-hept-6-ulosonate synthase [Pseudomonadota bacterium]MCG2750553.1 2-amino-3,7-dideoxy-D-threo-hept-6-ulosonate synthase [Desulfobacteraceae bacterium]